MTKRKPDPAETPEGGALPAAAESTKRQRVTFAVRRGGSVSLEAPAAATTESTEEHPDAG